MSFMTCARGNLELVTLDVTGMCVNYHAKVPQLITLSIYINNA